MLVIVKIIIRVFYFQNSAKFVEFQNKWVWKVTNTVISFCRLLRDREFGFYWIITLRKHMMLAWRKYLILLSLWFIERWRIWRLYWMWPFSYEKDSKFFIFGCFLMLFNERIFFTFSWNALIWFRLQIQKLFQLFTTFQILIDVNDLIFRQFYVIYDNTFLLYFWVQR